MSLVVKRGSWYCFRIVTSSSSSAHGTAPALFFTSADTEESWQLCVSRHINAMRSAGQEIHYVYSLAWLKGGDSQFSDGRPELLDVFGDEIAAFHVELKLRGIVTV